jgi:hypothetical protein
MVVAAYAPPMPNSPELSLHCDIQDLSVILRSGAESWAFALPSAAMQFASTLVERETKLVVYDGKGKVVFVTSVYPA